MEISRRFRQTVRGKRKNGSPQDSRDGGGAVEDLLAVVWRVLRNYPEAREALRVEVERMLNGVAKMEHDNQSV
ncbi:MAG TPA: hypothetical protein VGL53_17890 [Bryobacteraceae bacterium]|jgi:hypothetical protein